MAATPGPRFPPWLAPLIIVVLLGNLTFLTVTGVEAPPWLIATTVATIGAVLGIDIGLIGKRNGE